MALKSNFEDELQELTGMMEDLEKKGKSKPTDSVKFNVVRNVPVGENLEILFVKHDRLRNGWLNYDEFQNLLNDYSRGYEFTQEQRDRCFIYVNKSETGKIDLREVQENLPHLKEVDYSPEISEEMMELVRTQEPNLEVNDAELLSVGWDLLGTVIDGIKPEELFDIQNEIGKGTYSTIYKCVEKGTNKLYALKKIDISVAGDEIYDLQHELTFQMGCNAPQIAKYYKSFIVGTELYIFLEYLGGCLLELMKGKGLDESEARVILRELVRALAYLHSRDLVHRDIKAGSIFLSETGQVKLADFRVSTSINALHSTFAGTPLWIAPEIILESNYNEKVDIWSVGITAIELAKGVPPLHDLVVMQALTRIPLDPSPKLEGQFSSDYKDFVSFCLIKDAGTRPSALELLSHPFLSLKRDEPSLMGLLGEKANAAENSNKLLRFRSVRRDRAPQKEGDEEALKSNLVRKPTGAAGMIPKKIRESRDKKDKEKKEKKDHKHSKEDKEERRDKEERKDRKEEKEKEKEEKKEEKKEKKRDKEKEREEEEKRKKEEKDKKRRSKVVVQV